MKKFLKIIAAIILSLLIFLVSVLKYRQYQANQLLIPKNANVLIKISVDEIYKSVLMNMIKNPAYYFKQNKTGIKYPETNRFKHGLKIPASIYFYTITNQPKTALFSRFVIKDFVAFEKFVKQTLKLDIKGKQKEAYFAQNKTGNLAICYNKKIVSITISGNQKNFQQILLNLLEDENLQQLNDHPFSAIGSMNDHISIISTNNTTSVNFLAGKIEFSNMAVNSQFSPAKKPSHRSFKKESTVSFWLDASWKAQSPLNITHSNVVLNKDSLIKYYNGYLDFEWAGTTLQADSVISYEYNDDFEKVAKTSIQNKKVPDANFYIKTKGHQLYQYLANQHAINQIDTTLNKSFFPLYKIYATKNSQALILSSSKKNKNDSTFINTDDFLGLNINVLKMQREVEIPLFASYFKPLKHLEVRGKFIKPNKVNVTGTLEFVNRDINAIYQIIKVL